MTNAEIILAILDKAQSYEVIAEELPMRHLKLTPDVMEALDNASIYSFGKIIFELNGKAVTLIPLFKRDLIELSHEIEQKDAGSTGKPGSDAP